MTIDPQVDEMVHIEGSYCPHCELPLRENDIFGVGRERPQVVCQNCRCSYFVIRTGRLPYLLLARWERACKEKVNA